jgi:hypothetical protein
VSGYVEKREKLEAARELGLKLSTRGPWFIRRFGLWLADDANERLSMLKMRHWAA